MKRSIVVAAGLVWLTATTAPVFAAGDAGMGRAKAAACAGCHGENGNSVNPEWPKLAGQGEAYLVKQLTDFKGGVRQNPTMMGMAAGLGEQDMADVAAFFSSQQRQTGSAAKELVARGEKLYRGGDSAAGIAACMGCHGPSGAGNPAARFPSLGGQHAAYVSNQLKAFRDGSRSNDNAKMMQMVAAHMTDADIKAVAEYVQGLH